MVKVVRFLGLSQSADSKHENTHSGVISTLVRDIQLAREFMFLWLLKNFTIIGAL
jgi:hypothetical protein